MKSILHRSLLIGVIACSLVPAAAAQATSRPKPGRFAQAIVSFEQQDAEKGPAKGGILFVGSSSITRWKSLPEDFPDLPVLNRGFGGSVANDLIAFFEPVVLRHEPKLLVVYTGGNDINAKLTTAEALEDYTRFLTLVHEKLPQTRVIVNSVKISQKRINQIPAVLELNRQLQAWAKSHDWIRYIDSTSYLADEQGQPIRRYYVDDLMHLSPAGYAEWIKILGPVLHEEWARVQRGSAEPVAGVVAKQASPAKPERYAKTIDAFARQEPARHGIVFIGSSATTRWKSLAEDFPDLPVVNRAFGGSRLNDLIFHFDTIALRHEPKLLVIDIGGNDLNAGMTVEETVAEYLRLLEVVHTKLPQTRVVINSLGISIKRVAQIPQILEVNARLAAWVRGHDWARYVDRTSYQLRANGQPLREDYVDDLLHPSRLGYEEWIKVLSPVLHEEWARVKST